LSDVRVDNIKRNLEKAHEVVECIHLSVDKFSSCFLVNVVMKILGQ
jgi:hypothetical protein